MFEQNLYIASYKYIPIFNIALHEGVNNIPDTLFINKWNISGSTIQRRKQTINKWIDYFINK